MDIDLPAGRYVVAVSGGVDSVALLHLLAQKQNVERRKKNGEESSTFAVLRSPFSFVVAHYDHGIREDSAEDRKLVQALAKEYGLPFVYHAGKLGPKASEAVARQARYAFLHQVRTASGAKAIITAHHQDDVLETVILNLLRGTGRRGLSSLKSTDVIRRPLLHVPKQEMLRYAKEQGLQWREDSTNADERYLRNYIRRRLMPRFAKTDREALLAIAARAAELNAELATQTANYLHIQPAASVLDRHMFVLLPHAVAREVMAEWLLRNTGAELSRRMLERLVVAAKTGKAGTKVDVDAGHWLLIFPHNLALQPRER